MLGVPCSWSEGSITMKGASKKILAIFAEGVNEFLFYMLPNSHGEKVGNEP